MESSCIYRVYCSKCNKDQKKKMSWRKYLFYLTIDGKSKGYHDIDSTLVDVEPTKCVLGHDINTKRTKIIIKKKRGNVSKDVSQESEELSESDEFRTE